MFSFLISRRHPFKCIRTVRVDKLFTDCECLELILGNKKKRILKQKKYLKF